MKEALEILRILKKNSYDAYLVGGYPRDHYLGLESHDYDICTNARPEEIHALFPSSDNTFAKYGVVRLILNEQDYEITTYRREYEYNNHRTPSRIEFVSTLEEDLQRRDFVINTLCIDYNGEYVDLLGARNDLDQKIIRTVGNSDQKLEEDALRILRAIRFACTLQLELSEELKISIKKKKELLRSLSYERKREELDRIFMTETGISLLLELDLSNSLELPLLKNVQEKELLAIWNELQVSDQYPFTRKEKLVMKQLDHNNK